MALKDYIEKAKDYFNLGDEEEVTPVARPQVAVPNQTSNQPQPQVRAQAVSVQAESKPERKQGRSSDSVSNSTRQATPQRQSSAAIVPTIAIKEPAAYDNIMESARIVRNGESVLVNFKNMGDQQARRSIDFLTGVVFTLDGDIQNVGGQIFLLTPSGMTVDAEKELSILSGRNFEGLDAF
ncbi:MAG: cell division protein SepF [Streptococcaceae bacterium]|jgi:cell division inhibitor SepF|nr:cell division protein SepF [Streptococcaceae bacterium]